jgi:hypothetical protein
MQKPPETRPEIRRTKQQERLRIHRRWMLCGIMKITTVLLFQVVSPDANLEQHRAITNAVNLIDAIVRRMTRRSAIL